MVSRLNRKASRNQVGATLIELLVVVALSVFFATLGLSRLRQFTSANSARNEEQQWLQTLHWARLIALNYGATVRICFLDPQQTCQTQATAKMTIFLDPTNSNHPIEHQSVLGQIPISQHLRLQLPRRSIKFDSEGQSPGANQTLQFCNQNWQWQLVISPAGRLSETSPEAGCSFTK